jgi:hypothetical protein
MSKLGRNAKKLPQILDNQLKSYAIAAGATGVALLALAQPSAAEVIYKPAHAPIPSRYFPTYLDINGDGIPDFRFNNSSRPGGHYESDFLFVDPLTGGVIVSSGLAAALPKGALVGPSDQWVQGTCFMAGTYLFGYFGRYVHNYYGLWNDVENRFLGVSFSLDGETHYGWIRMNVNLGKILDVRAIVTGYAYESVANAPIRAGQTSGNAESNDNDAIAPRSMSLGMLAGGAVFHRHGGVSSYDYCGNKSE